jgi:hypothetical protein
MRIISAATMRMPGVAMAKPVKKPKNLSLDPDVVARGERYSQAHGTNLSRLVGDFLRALPVDDGLAPLPRSPAVRRLRGIAAGGRADREAYRAHLLRKHGSLGPARPDR